MAQPMLTPGIRLKGRYVVEFLIATGGYASVYRVTDAVYGVTRAMKEVVDPDEGIRRQFTLEADFLNKLNHPNIPRGYDHFEEHGRAYLIMDYVEGQDLEQLLASTIRATNQPLDEAQVLRWLLPICDALDAMHRQPVPIIHRDIKPANIKLTATGIPILIDFGLAKHFVPGPTNQAAQGITPGFAPPEQYLAQGKTDARSDIYSVGATMYTLLTGQEPPEAPSRLLAQSGKAGSPMTPARMLNPRISATTARIIDKAMDVGAELRFQSARAMQEELRRALEHIEYGRPYVATGESTQPLTPDINPDVLHANGNGYRRKGAALPGGQSGSTAAAVLTPPAAFAVPEKSPPTAPKPAPMVEKVWFNLGGPRLKGLGKAGLYLSAAEIYCGLLIAAAIAGVVGTRGFTQPPNSWTIGAGVLWLAIIITLTVLVIRVWEKPIARRGKISGVRRGFQGLLLFGLWGGMNVAAFMYYNTLTAEIGLISLGLLALANILNGLLSVANVLA